MSDASARVTAVSLTDVELSLLDGRCSPKVQNEVNAAKSRIVAAALYGDLPPRLAGFIADVVTEAETKGYLRFYWTNVRVCPVCDRNDGYWPHKRATRYANKGAPNYDKPKRFQAVELTTMRVTMQDHVTLGCCQECWMKVQPTLVRALTDVRAEIPKFITGHEPAFRFYQNRRCTKCGWEGHEGQMGREYALMGGTYPATCPNCKAGGTLFSRDIETTEDFTVVPVSQPITSPAGALAYGEKD